jgi:photosystem II stability/assembly factor-like uncharacterized protein
MSRIKIIALVALASIFAFFLALSFKSRADAKSAQLASYPLQKSGVPLANAGENDANDESESPAEFWLETAPASDDYIWAPKPQTRPAIVEDGHGSYREQGQFGGPVTGPTWKFIGPAPIPNGQTEHVAAANVNRRDPVSGRITAIAVDAFDPNIVYAGAAQGGVYRSLNGGASWVQLMDNASQGLAAGTPLAIGRITIDPLNRDRVFVGTGEGNLCSGCFFGTGLYVINNATFNPTVSGPFNANSGNDPLAPAPPAGSDVFTGRSINAIAVDNTNSDNAFVATGSGQGGWRQSTFSILPRRGLFRTTNLTSANPTWTRLQITGATLANTICTDVVIEPGVPNNVTAMFYGQAAGDPVGIYHTTNALAAVPVWVQTQVLPNAINGKLAIQKTGATVTIYATADQTSGTIYKSTDGGVTWANIPGANGFAAGQGFYDISVGVDPTNAANVVVGGQAGINIFKKSTDGGATFATATAANPITDGLHADVHALTYAPSNPLVIYHGNDGGIWRSNDAGQTWVSKNTNLSATQFQGLALHPTDRNFTIGGTQDNGTQFLNPAGVFSRTDFGDGGYSLIDQSAANTTTVTAYHTYFNQRNNLIGSGRELSGPCIAAPEPTPASGNWSFHGIYSGAVDTVTTYCDGSKDAFSGILLTDNVLFYAPMNVGPGTPNTWYFGTDKLYRSADSGQTGAAVSQFLGDFVTDLAVSPQDDNYRIVGTQGPPNAGTGKVYATTTGANPMLQIFGAGATNGPTNAPAFPVERLRFDPNNKNIAYAAFGGFGTPGVPVFHMWKTTNLNVLPAGNVTWTAVSNGLPDIPVNGIAIDPLSVSGGASTDIYAGTDNGVYLSTDSGATWAPYGQGFPHVSVTTLEIQSANRVLRAATYGRGMYEIALNTPAPPSPTPTPTATPTATPPAQALNMSTRMRTDTGNNVGIGGFTITGAVAKHVIIRAIGPSLTKFGFAATDVLPDPLLEVHGPGAFGTITNNNWRDSQEAQIKTDGLAPTNDLESAIDATLPPGAYTAIIKGNTGTAQAGLCLFEVYDLDTAPGSKLANLSTRAFVGTGNSVVIAGFVLGNSTASDRVVVRGLGPSLSSFGIANALADPTLELRNENGTLLLANNDWQDNAAQATDITAAGLAPSNAKESALSITLPPGLYTAILAGLNNGQGVGVVEVYDRGP